MSAHEPSPEIQAVLASVLTNTAALPRPKLDALLGAQVCERIAAEAGAGDEAARAPLYSGAIETRLRRIEERLATSFARFDLDGDGVVTVEEVQKILSMDKLDAEAFVSQFDSDGDERVDYGEFLRASLNHQGFAVSSS